MNRILRACALVAFATTCLSWTLASADDPSSSPTPAIFPSPTPTTAGVGTSGSPVQILQCIVALPTGGGDGSTVQIAIPFMDVGSEGLTAVKFEIDFVDAFGSVVQRETGIVTGEFSPGVRIDPAKPPLGGIAPGSLPYVDGPGNAAFEVFLLNPRDVSQTLCAVDAVKFDDGSVWQRGRQ